MNTLDGVVPFSVSSTTQVKPNPKVLIARFGDGYEQRLADGINPNLRSWACVWTNISLVYTKLLNDFFEAQVGTRFLWTQPIPYDVEGQKVFTSDDFNFTYSGGLIVGYAATLDQKATP